MFEGKGLEELAKLCDQAILSNNDQDMLLLVEVLAEYTRESHSDQDRCFAHYQLGNLHSDLSRISKENVSGWRSEEYPHHLTAAINHCRNALSILPEDCQALGRCIQTNLSNALAHQRRNVEVLNDWDCDFSQTGDAPFVSALSKARELIFISKLLNDKSHQSLYQYEAFLLLKRLEGKRVETDHELVLYTLDNDPEVLHYLKNGGSHFKSLEDWQGDFTPTPYSSEERNYRAWCLERRLFLNPINDLTSEWIADQDILQFPNHVTQVGQGPFYPAAFSALKREYSFARYMAYEGFHGIHPDFETDRLFLSDTLDYVDYSGATEKVKTAFRVCFSVLDSLALLMNNYFECNSAHVAFTPRWIRDNFKNNDGNFFIDALYWLSCDLFDNENVVSDTSKWKAPNPHASNIRKLRNSIEHGWLRVAESEVTVWEKTGDFSHQITGGELKSHTMSVLKIVRSALTYMSFAVRLNEASRPKGDGLMVQIPVDMVDDRLIP